MEDDVMTCEKIRALLPAFLGNEIQAGESHQVEEHLNACPACRRYRGFEAAFDRVLKRTLRAEAAPPSLILGVQRALDLEGPGRRASSRVAASWKPWALAAAILLAMLAPITLGYQRHLLFPGESIKGVEQVVRGTLVCNVCERLGVPIQDQRGCRVHGHHTALKCDDKPGLWEFIETDATRPLITDSDRIGDRVELRGVFMDDLRYVKVSSVKYLTGEGREDLGM